LSIRTRLLLLVLAVWLPAVVGFGLIARGTYLRETEAERQRVQQLAQVLNSVIEREIGKRAVAAATLAASTAVRDGNVREFHVQARAAMQDSQSWAFLVDGRTHLANTLVPYEEMRPLPRAADAPPLVSGEPRVFLIGRGPVTQAAVLCVFAPEAHVAPPRYNVGIGFRPAVFQSILEQQQLPPGSVAAIIDAQQVVIARSREPQKWFGQQATGDLRKRAEQRAEGFAESVTLDGVPSLTYLTRPNRYGWAVVIALPRASLTEAAQRLTMQAVAAAGALLLIGLVLALYAARRIGAPVRALRQAAVELGHDAVPPVLTTGVTEADEVSRALHHAGVRSQEATQTLERRVAEAVVQAREAQEKLHESQKHEAIGRLTGGIAHDFNNLLQTISTGQHVLDRFVADGPQRRVLEASMRATAKAADLVRQLLTFGRAQPLQPRPVDLGDWLLKSQDLVAKAIGEQVRLTASIEHGLPPLFVDPVQLELAVLNLVFNARDALPQGGGHVTILGRLAEDDVPAEGAGPYVCVEVADDGPGMAPETAARAFEPYFTTKPLGRGSGLGLAQVMSFARQSGGDVRLNTSPGGGTRVAMLLPAATGAAAAEALPHAAVEAQPGRPLAILMVEDDALVASVVVPALEIEGHRVQLCRSAEEAVAALSGEHDFDILFTDVIMPGRLTGTDLVNWCREHRPALPAVVATGNMTTWAELEGRVRVLRKPYGLLDLMAALRAAVA
jgi:signal transduction histidine kinase